MGRSDRNCLCCNVIEALHSARWVDENLRVGRGVAEPLVGVGDAVESHGAGEQGGRVQLAGGQVGEGLRKFLRGVVATHDERNVVGGQLCPATVR